MGRRSILVISPNQFGYLSDYYYYCKYLKEDFEINFLCFDRSLKKQELKGVNVEYLGFTGNKLTRYLKWIKAVFDTLNNGQEDIVFISNFQLCFLFSLLFPKRNFVLDIRTGAVVNNVFINYFQNLFIRFNTFFFKNVTILSEGLIKLLRIDPNKCHWLPLGAEFLENCSTDFKKLNLIYVGTFENRNIHQTIQGFAKFYTQYKGAVECSYDIFGFGSPEEVKLIQDAIDDHSLNGLVKFHGRKNHAELYPYFKKCNVGVSYIPITKYFDFQPPTKTFEYILSGMICIATDTYENRRVITDKNGVLCGDSSMSFYEALELVFQKRDQFVSKEIVESLSEYEWSSIVRQNLNPYFNSILKHD